jgi:hypothetical protein
MSSRNFYFNSLSPLDVGQFVIVEADRGQDIGVVVDVFSMRTLIARTGNDREMRGNIFKMNMIYRVASQREKDSLSQKTNDENGVVEVFCLFSIIIFD